MYVYFFGSNWKDVSSIDFHDRDMRVEREWERNSKRAELFSSTRASL